jgi:hypothetical protein
MKRNDIGAKPGALAFVTLDGGGHVRDDHTAGNDEVTGPGLVELDQPRLGRPRLARRELDIVAEIISEADRRHSLLGSKMGVQARAAESHRSLIARWRLCSSRGVTVISRALVGQRRRRRRKRRRRRPIGVVFGFSALTKSERRGFFFFFFFFFFWFLLHFFITETDRLFGQSLDFGECNVNED